MFGFDFGFGFIFNYLMHYGLIVSFFFFFSAS